MVLLHKSFHCRTPFRNPKGYAFLCFNHCRESSGILKHSRLLKGSRNRHIQVCSGPSFNYRHPGTRAMELNGIGTNAKSQRSFISHGNAVGKSFNSINRLIASSIYFSVNLILK